jgi:hypothetical protein
MPNRYYLHVQVDDTFADDPEGIELADLDTARAQAVAGGREMIARRVLSGKPIDVIEILICDVEGSVLDRVGFTDLVRLKAASAATGM